MRRLLMLTLAALIPACGGPSKPGLDDPAVPKDVIEGIETVSDVSVEIDAETLEHLKLLTGEVGEVDFPSTRDVLAQCEEGDPGACVSVGTRLMHGTWGLDKDAAAAVRLFTYACDSGEVEGCHSLAVALKYGRGVAQDEAGSVPLFERACNGGHVVACSFYGDAYMHGRGVQTDISRGVAIYERACLLGAFCRDVARHRFAQMLTASDRPFQAEGETAEAACADGDPEGCHWEALALAVETDSDERYARIEKLLTTACDGEVADACASLGFHYLHRHTSPGYTAKASAAFKRACDLGTACDHLEACPAGDPTRIQALSRGVQQAEQDCQSGQMDRCLSFAISLKTGNGIERDHTRATLLFSRVCESGDPAACWYLGGAYKRGQGVPQDEAHAAELYRTSCDADHANGCVDLAFAHVHGRGVPQDLSTAVSLFDKACTLGTACDHADHYRVQLP